MNEDIRRCRVDLNYWMNYVVRVVDSNKVYPYQEKLIKLLDEEKKFEDFLTDKDVLL